MSFGCCGFAFDLVFCLELLFGAFVLVGVLNRLVDLLLGFCWVGYVLFCVVCFVIVDLMLL